MTRTFEGDLKQELQDPKSAKYFGAAQAKSSFAITLAEARRQLNLTQQQLADRIGFSQSYIAKLEGGEANPTLERIGSLLAIIGLSLTTGTTALSPYPETPWVTIWAGDNDNRRAEINYERSASISSASINESRILEELPV